MRCEDVSRRLDDWLDGALAAESQQRVEDHLARCPECRRQAEELRALIAATSRLPRSLQPGRDLWPDIAARIGDRRVSDMTPERAASRRPQVRLAAAAAVLVAAGSILTWSVVRLRGPARPAGVAAAARPTATEVRLASLGDAGADLQVARNELLAVLERRRSSMSPQTRAVIDDNMRIIDEAIRRIESALERDPNDRHLAGLLAAARHQEIQLLKRAAQLPADT